MTETMDNDNTNMINTNNHLNISAEKQPDQAYFEKNMSFDNGEEDELNNGLNKTFTTNEPDTNPDLIDKTKFHRIITDITMNNSSTRSSQQKQNTDSRGLPDILKIIENMHNTQELVSLFENYEPKSKLLTLEELKSSENTKIKRYKDCVYFGNFINGKRHGQGVMVYHSGRIYEGYWENDTKHGKGFELCPNGNKYEGHFVNGKPEGVGTFSWRNGEMYEGEWKNGLKHGSGLWKGIKGDSYIGEWKYGKADGYGVHTWKNGDRYEGEFKVCLKHGHGTEKFANGDFYVGNYVNGKPDGYGEYYWANGCQYKGFFKNGLRHGKGIWRKGSSQGDKYDGEWINDKKSGSGTYTWASGNYYKGNYFDDLRHGYGEMYWIDGSLYKGNWEKGIQHGDGELLIPGKQPKSGLFQNNIYIGDENEVEESELINEEKLISQKKLTKKRSNNPNSLNTPMHSYNPNHPMNPANSGTETVQTLRRTINPESTEGFTRPRTLDTFTRTAQNTSQMVQTIPQNTPKTGFDASVQTDFPQDVFNTSVHHESKAMTSRMIGTNTEEKSILYSTQKTASTVESQNKRLLPPVFHNKGQNQRETNGRIHNHSSGRGRPPARSPDQMGNSSHSSDVMQRSPLPNINSTQLNQKELAKWNHMKEKLKVNLNKFNNMEDPEVCAKIRALINPPIWRYWKKT